MAAGPETALILIRGEFPEIVRQFRRLHGVQKDIAEPGGIGQIASIERHQVRKTRRMTAAADLAAYGAGLACRTRFQGVQQGRFADAAGAPCHRNQSLQAFPQGVDPLPRPGRHGKDFVPDSPVDRCHLFRRSRRNQVRLRQDDHAGHVSPGRQNQKLVQDEEAQVRVCQGRRNDVQVHVGHSRPCQVVPARQDLRNHSFCGLPGRDISRIKPDQVARAEGKPFLFHVAAHFAGIDRVPAGDIVIPAVRAQHPAFLYQLFSSTSLPSTKKRTDETLPLTRWRRREPPG